MIKITDAMVDAAIAELRDYENYYLADTQRGFVRSALTAALSVMPGAAAVQPASVAGWDCKAMPWLRLDPAQDCNWPVCGCDPYADKVIEALEESGMLSAAPAPPASPDVRGVLEALEHLLFWNEGIKAGRGNYYPQEHIAIIQFVIKALSTHPAPASTTPPEQAVYHATAENLPPYHYQSDEPRSGNANYSPDAAPMPDSAAESSHPVQGE